MLKKLTEEYYGNEIADDEWRQAKADSEAKLQRIIERQGDADGKRTEPWYLAMLIAEDLKSTRMMYETLVQKKAKEKPTAELRAIQGYNKKLASIVPEKNWEINRRIEKSERKHERK